MSEGQRKRNEKILRQELDENELESVSGGASIRQGCTNDWDSCSKTYKDGENCWGTDDCKNLVYVHSNSSASQKCYTDFWCTHVYKGCTGTMIDECTDNVGK